MREIQRVTDMTKRDAYNCKHTLSYRYGKTSRLSENILYQRKGRCRHVENEMSPVNRD